MNDNEDLAVNEDVQNDLVRSVCQKDLVAFKFILHREGGKPFLRPNTHECSPFHTAAMVGCTDIVKYILDTFSVNKNADVNKTEKDCNKTALHFAATSGYVETVLYLLIAGANPDALSFDLWTPMHYAAENGRADVVVTLLENGADPDIENETLQTPVHLSAVYDHPACFRVLVIVYGSKVLKRQHEVSMVVRASVPGLIPDMCKKISTYAVAPCNLDILDVWDRSPTDWAIETINCNGGEEWDTTIREILRAASEHDGWFFL